MSTQFYLLGVCSDAPGSLAGVGAAIEAVDGIGRLGQGVCAIPGGHGVAVLAMPTDHSEIEPARRNMLAHTRALEAAMQVCPVLPVRFGHILPSREALEAMAAAGGAAFAEHLSALGDRAEYGVRISGRRDAAMKAIGAEHPDLGIAAQRLRAADAGAYHQRIALGRRVDQLLSERRRAAETDLIAAIAPVADSHRLRPAETDVELLRAEFLLPPSREPRLVATVREACARLRFTPGVEPDARIVGPAPPYHFVSLRLPIAETALGG